MLKLIIDGDPMVYRSGFASQSAVYEIVYEDATGIGEYKFDRVDGITALKQYKEWQARNPGAEILSETKTTRAEPVSHALQIVRTSIEGIQQEVAEKFKDSPASTQLVLSGPGNYRKDIATIRPYKGNRDPAHIPVHYNAIRNYMTEQHGAFVVHGREADDEVSIRAWQLWRSGDKQGYVVATIDKDLDQVPGWHYDYMKKVFYNVSETDADKAFWRQVLSGDLGDNVPGCFRMGPERAARIIEDQYDSGATPEKLWDGVLEEYKLSILKHGVEKCGYENACAAALETGQLVWMQRKPGELWMPPNQPFGTVKGDKDD